MNRIRKKDKTFDESIKISFKTNVKDNKDIEMDKEKRDITVKKELSVH